MRVKKYAAILLGECGALQEYLPNDNLGLEVSRETICTIEWQHLILQEVFIVGQRFLWFG